MGKWSYWSILSAGISACYPYMQAEVCCTFRNLWQAPSSEAQCYCHPPQMYLELTIDYVYVCTPVTCIPIFIMLIGTVHEKIAPLIYYKNVIKMHHVCIAITSQRLTLSTSYFHHFILHHFSTVKCILESWTISVPTFLRAIPPGV